MTRSNCSRARRYDANAVLLGSLSLDDWRSLLRADARAAVLTAATGT